MPGRDPPCFDTRHQLKFPSLGPSSGTLEIRLGLNTAITDEWCGNADLSAAGLQSYNRHVSRPALNCFAFSRRGSLLSHWLQCFCDRGLRPCSQSPASPEASSGNNCLVEAWRSSPELECFAMEPLHRPSTNIWPLAAAKRPPPRGIVCSLISAEEPAHPVRAPGVCRGAASDGTYVRPCSSPTCS